MGDSLWQTSSLMTKIMIPTSCAIFAPYSHRSIAQSDDVRNDMRNWRSRWEWRFSDGDEIAKAFSHTEFPTSQHDDLPRRKVLACVKDSARGGLGMEIYMDGMLN